MSTAARPQSTAQQFLLPGSDLMQLPPYDVVFEADVPFVVATHAEGSPHIGPSAGRSHASSPSAAPLQSVHASGLGWTCGARQDGIRSSCTVAPDQQLWQLTANRTKSPGRQPPLAAVVTFGDATRAVAFSSPARGCNVRPQGGSSAPAAAAGSLTGPQDPDPRSSPLRRSNSRPREHGCSSGGRSNGGVGPAIQPLQSAPAGRMVSPARRAGSAGRRRINLLEVMKQQRGAAVPSQTQPGQQQQPGHSKLALRPDLGGPYARAQRHSRVQGPGQSLAQSKAHAASGAARHLHSILEQPPRQQQQLQRQTSPGGSAFQMSGLPSHAAASAFNVAEAVLAAAPEPFARGPPQPPFQGAGVIAGPLLHSWGSGEHPQQEGMRRSRSQLTPGTPRSPLSPACSLPVQSPRDPCSSGVHALTAFDTCLSEPPPCGNGGAMLACSTPSPALTPRPWPAWASPQPRSADSAAAAGKSDVLLQDAAAGGLVWQLLAVVKSQAAQIQQLQRCAAAVTAATAAAPVSASAPAVSVPIGSAPAAGVGAASGTNRSNDGEAPPKPQADLPTGSSPRCMVSCSAPSTVSFGGSTARTVGTGPAGAHPAAGTLAADSISSLRSDALPDEDGSSLARSGTDTSFGGSGGSSSLVRGGAQTSCGGSGLCRSEARGDSDASSSTGWSRFIAAGAATRPYDSQPFVLPDSSTSGDDDGCASVVGGSCCPGDACSVSAAEKAESAAVASLRDQVCRLANVVMAMQLTQEHFCENLMAIREAQAGGGASPQAPEREQLQLQPRQQTYKEGHRGRAEADHSEEQQRQQQQVDEDAGVSGELVESLVCEVRALRQRLTELELESADGARTAHWVQPAACPQGGELGRQERPHQQGQQCPRRATEHDRHEGQPQGVLPARLSDCAGALEPLDKLRTLQRHDPPTGAAVGVAWSQRQEEQIAALQQRMAALETAAPLPVAGSVGELRTAPQTRQVREQPQQAAELAGPQTQPWQQQQQQPSRVQDRDTGDAARQQDLNCPDAVLWGALSREVATVQQGLGALHQHVAALHEGLHRHEQHCRETMDRVAAGLERVAECVLAAWAGGPGGWQLQEQQLQQQLQQNAIWIPLGGGSCGCSGTVGSVAVAAKTFPQVPQRPDRDTARNACTEAPRHREAGSSSGAAYAGLCSGSCADEGACVCRSASGGLDPAENPGVGELRSAPAAGLQHALTALQRDMRQLRAAMVAQVVVEAAGTGSASSWRKSRRGSQLVVPWRQPQPPQAQLQPLSQHEPPPPPLQVRGGEEEVEEQQLRLRLEHLSDGVLQLREGEAAIVQTQEALVDLITDLRHDLDDLRRKVHNPTTAYDNELYNMYSDHSAGRSDSSSTTDGDDEDQSQDRDGEDGGSSRSFVSDRCECTSVQRLEKGGGDEGPCEVAFGCREAVGGLSNGKRGVQQATGFEQRTHTHMPDMDVDEVEDSRREDAAAIIDRHHGNCRQQDGHASAGGRHSAPGAVAEASCGGLRHPGLAAMAEPETDCRQPSAAQHRTYCSLEFDSGDTAPVQGGERKVPPLSPQRQTREHPAEQGAELLSVV